MCRDGNEVKEVRMHCEVRATCSISVEHIDTLSILNFMCRDGVVEYMAIDKPMQADISLADRMIPHLSKL